MMLPLSINGVEVRLWLHDPLGACATYQLKKKKKKNPLHQFTVFSLPSEGALNRIFFRGDKDWKLTSQFGGLE
jgi:hypothetical protein